MVLKVTNEDDEYKIIKIKGKVYKKLVKMKALYQLQEGIVLTNSNLIDMLIDSQPKMQISGKPIE